MGSEMCIRDRYYLVLFRGDTLIYACSPDSLTEINEILAETGYLRR